MITTVGTNLVLNELILMIIFSIVFVEYQIFEHQMQ